MQTSGPKKMKRIRGKGIWASRRINAKPNVIRKALLYMRRVYGMKVGAQYPGRSASLSERTNSAARRGDEVAEVSRRHSSSSNHERRPELNESERSPGARWILEAQARWLRSQSEP